MFSSSYASYICKAYRRRLQPDSEAIEPRVGIDRLIDCFYCVWIYWDESGIETIGMNRFHDESSPRTGKYFGPIVANTSRLRTIFAIVHFANNHENILSLPSLIARARYSSIRSHFRVQRFPFTPPPFVYILQTTKSWNDSMKFSGIRKRHRFQPCFYMKFTYK